VEGIQKVRPSIVVNATEAQTPPPEWLRERFRGEAAARTRAEAEPAKSEA
jgi:hypothetical protein